MVPLRAEELLLPGHAEELPDLAVRRADLLRGLPRRRRGRGDVPRRDRARAHGGGHREVAARRRRDRSHPRRRPLAGRLQPRRHPADRDRHQADPGRGGEGAGRRTRVRLAAARPDPRPRCLRGADGPGQPARRREPVAGAEGLRGARDPHRDQERQLVPLGRAGGALRDAAPRRHPRRGRLDPAGDAALARGHRRDHERSREVGRRRLPLLPRARPGAGGAEPGVGRGAAAHAARRTRCSSARGSRPTGATPTSRCATSSPPAWSA